MLVLMSSNGRAQARSTDAAHRTVLAAGALGSAGAGRGVWTAARHGAAEDNGRVWGPAPGVRGRPGAGRAPRPARHTYNSSRVL